MEDVNYHNIEATYITAENVISQELADVLIELVDERGKDLIGLITPIA